MPATSTRLRGEVERQLEPLKREVDGLVEANDAAGVRNLLYSALVDLLTRESAKVWKGRSEKLDPAQLALLLAGLENEPPLDETDAVHDEQVESAPEPEKKERKHTPHGRRKLPPELPRETTVLAVPETEQKCPDCGEERAVIGHETSEVLEFVPAHFKVLRFEREKRACRKCRGAVVCAPPADKIFDRILAGPQLLAQVVVSKYADHLPLNRQQRIYQRLGVTIAMGTLVGWVARICDDLEPIVTAMWTEAQCMHLLQGDGTGLRVLDRDAEDGSRLGTMWCYVGNRKVVVFRYTPDAKGATGPWLHLAGREGFTLMDASNTFDRLFNGKAASAIEVGCWAHARRDFFALKDTEPEAARALDYIQRLYRIEHQADADQLDPAARARIRQERSKNILRELHRWLLKMKDRHPPKSKLAIACAYIVRHWKALNRFLEDSALPLDNNFCELQIRDVAVGRKNYLFAGNDDGGRRAAVMYSITRTCAVNGVDPVAYISDVLTRLAACRAEDRIEGLLPYNWKPVAASSQPQDEAGVG